MISGRWVSRSNRMIKDPVCLPVFTDGVRNRETKTMMEAQLRLTEPDSGSCHDVGLVPRGGLGRGYMRHDFFIPKES